jgi:DNA mismatch repair protein MutL
VRDSIRNALMKSRPVSNMPRMPASPGMMTSPPGSPSSDVNVEEGSIGFGAIPRRVDFPNQPLPHAPVLPFSEFSQALEDMPSGDPLPWPANAPAAQRMPSPNDTTSTSDRLPEIQIPPPPVFGRPAPSTESAPASLARRVPDTHGALGHLPSGWEQADSYSQLPDLRPLGQLHESFIIAAGRDGLWIIDQHVAHERILFEKVLRERRSGKPEVQRLLMPIVLKLTPGQEFEYARIADELNASGFETEPFGQRTIAIKAAPAGVSPGDIEKIVFEILEISEDELRNASVDEIRRGVSATIACRAAIKINTRLEPAKIDWLLRALSACDYPMNCPHGRPVALRYSTKDILRSFHRI